MSRAGTIVADLLVATVDEPIGAQVQFIPWGLIIPVCGCRD